MIFGRGLPRFVFNYRVELRVRQPFGRTSNARYYIIIIIIIIIVLGRRNPTRAIKIRILTQLDRPATERSSPQSESLRSVKRPRRVYLSRRRRFRNRNLHNFLISPASPSTRQPLSAVGPDSTQIQFRRELGRVITPWPLPRRSYALNPKDQLELGNTLKQTPNGHTRAEPRMTVETVFVFGTI